MHSIRSTQRPPRSCIRCAKRRVRCDKKIPCQECISRGLELTCERETVRVKGKLITPTTSQPLSGPSYQDLLEENQRLKAQIAGQTKPALDDEDCQHGEILNITESFENELFIGVDTSGRTPTVQSEADIYWPSRNCVMNLITYGRTWTSWIHYALHHPTFEAECEDFLNRGVEQRSQAHPLWLAIYFSFMSAVLIFMDDSEAQAAGISDDANVLLLNWYDSSLYFLDKAEFLRHHDPRSVQTIAILGIVFNNVGEIKFHHTLWGAAIRIAQFLKMDDDRAHPNETPLETQLRRRLWWTLIICEWLPAPFHRPCINEDDFRVKFPDVIDDEELVSPSTDWDPRPRQVQYHIAMSQLCTVIHRFRCSLKQSSGKTTDIVALVSKADENLATLIGELPPHLQGGQGAIESSQNETVSWMWWQKINLSLVLFYHRIVINRTLQDHWVQDPATFARTRAICLGAARSIIALSAGCTKSLARHRPWGTSLHLFCAGIILAIELKFHADDAKAEYLEDIKVCIKFLNGVKVQSSLAARAVEMLQAQISDLGIDEKLP